MGNQASILSKALKEFESLIDSKNSTGWDSILAPLIDVVPYWEQGLEAVKRYALDYKNAKALDTTLQLLAHELRAVDLNARDYIYDSTRVTLLLRFLDKLLSSKAQYKRVSKADLAPVMLIIRAAALNSDGQMLMEGLSVVRMIIERVGFAERKASSKQYNQLKREAAAKEKFCADGGIEALLDCMRCFHARNDELVVDALLRIIVSVLASHQDTTPFDAVTHLLKGLLPFHGLLWEWSRSDYPRLRVSACGVLRAIFLESDDTQVAALQAGALKWGGLLWHLRLALRPCPTDSPFSKPDDAELKSLQLLWSLYGMTGNDVAVCPPVGQLRLPDDMPAALHRCYDHVLAREASREMVAMLTYRNASASNVIRRCVPPPLFNLIHADADSSKAKSPLHDAVVVHPAMFATPAARLVPSLAPTASVDASVGRLSGAGPAVMQMKCWTSDSDMPVALGSKGFLWWDVTLCAYQSNRPQRKLQRAKVKHSWLKVVAAPTHLDAATPSVNDVASEDAHPQTGTDTAAPPVSPTGAAAPTAPHTPKSSAAPAAVSAPLLMQSAGTHWMSFWNTLMSGGTTSPTMVWTRSCLNELRDALWAAESGLDKQRRQYKLSAQERGAVLTAIGVAKAIVGVAGAANGGSATPRSKSKDRHTGAATLLAGGDAADDGSPLIPDTKGAPTDILTAADPTVASIPTPFIPWDYAAFDVRFRTLDNLLYVDGYYVAMLLAALRQPPGGALVTVSSSLPRSLLGAVAVEDNPRRRYALLCLLRTLVHLTVQGKPFGSPQSGVGLAISVFESPELVSYLCYLLAHINSGVGDVASLRPLPGADAAYCTGSRGMEAMLPWPTATERVASAPTPSSIDASSARGPGVAVYFDRGTVLNMGVRVVDSTGVAKSKDPQSWLLSREFPVAGETAHWQALWRQEAVLILRALLTLESNARWYAAIDHGLSSLLPLLIVPTGVQQEDDTEATDIMSPPGASSLAYEVGTLLRVNRACADTGAATTAGDARSANTPAIEVEAIEDPDTTLTLSQRHMNRSILARLAGEALLSAVTSWPALCKTFAREDFMQALVLPLLQAPNHPKIIAVILKLLRAIVPRIPLYLPALSRHALYQALLLTAQPRSVAGGDGQQADGEPKDGGGPGPTGAHAKAYVSLGSSAGGLCEDAAQLLYDTHLAQYDHSTYGWHEMAYASQMAAARLTVGFVDTPPSTSSIVSRADALKSRSHLTTEGGAIVDEGSALAPFLPAALVSILRTEGPEAFARIFNAKFYAGSAAMWSEELRQYMFTSLNRQMKQAIDWVRATDAAAGASTGGPVPLANSAIRQSLHPCVPPRAEGSNQSSAGTRTRELEQPYPGQIHCSGSTVLVLPPLARMPPPRQIRYAQLDDEPRIAGIYLRAYVSGTDKPKDQAAFLTALLKSIGDEVLSFCAAHLALAQALEWESSPSLPSKSTAQTDGTAAADDADEDENIPAARAYRRYHFRLLLTLRAARKLLQDYPGMKVERDAVGSIALLFGVPFGRYPKAALRAGMSNVLVTATDYFITDFRKPLSMILELLLPTDALADQAVTQQAATNDPAAKRTKPSVSTSLSNAILTPMQMRALKVLATGHTGPISQDEAGPDQPCRLPGSAATGVFRGTDSPSLLSVALDIACMSVKPPTQVVASRKAVQVAAESHFLSLLIAYIGWIVPVQVSKTDALLTEYGYPSNATQIAAVSNAVASAVDPHAMSSRQRERLVLCAPLAVASLRLVAMCAACDPGAQLFVDNSALLYVLLRCARAPWAASSSSAASSSATYGASTPASIQSCRSSLFRIAAPALNALHALAPVFALRRALLLLGLPVLLLQTAVGKGAPEPTQRGREQLAAVATPSSLSIGVETSTRSAESTHYNGPDAVDTEDVGELELLEAAKMRLWPIRLCAEEILRIVCDKSGTVGTKQADHSTDLSIIAIEAAASMEGGLESPLSSPGGGPRHGGSVADQLSPTRRMTFGAAKLANKSHDLASKRLISFGSFATTAIERSIRGAPPTNDSLQAINTIQSILQNLLTPPLFKAFSPSAMDAYTQDAVSQTKSIVEVMLKVSGEQMHIAWTNAMSEKLLSRLSHEVALIDRRVLSVGVFRQLVGLDPNARIVGNDMVAASKPAPPASKNPFGSAEPPTPTNVQQATGPSKAAPTLFSWAAYENADLFKVLYPA